MEEEGKGDSTETQQANNKKTRKGRRDREKAFDCYFFSADFICAIIYLDSSLREKRR